MTHNPTLQKEAQTMLPQNILEYGREDNAIRETAAYAARRAEEIGAENVFNFSIGNPNVPAPAIVTESLMHIIQTVPPEVLHAYTPAPGMAQVRRAVADDLNRRFGTDYTANDLYLTAGASAALSIACRATLVAGDEVIIFAPYFPEYAVFAEVCGARSVILKCREEDFQIDLAAFEQAVTKKTKLVIVNSPSNPSGSIFSGETIDAMADILRKKEAEFGHAIYILADEPYRELVYDDDVTVPFIPNHYADTIYCYSYSKTLSLPGERIGYLLVPPKAADSRALYAAICGASRVIGNVNNPSLFQYLLQECVGATADLTVYKTNRDLLCAALTEYGFKMAKPDGAFYLFVKTPEPDDLAFCARARQYELMLVPGSAFGYPGYVRISYCVDTDTIRRSLPAFRALAEAYRSAEGTL